MMFMNATTFTIVHAIIIIGICCDLLPCCNFKLVVFLIFVIVHETKVVEVITSKETLKKSTKRHLHSPSDIESSVYKDVIWL